MKSFDSSSLAGVAEHPSWGWDVYFRDSLKKKVGRFEYQLIHHEVGHTIGLSHPGERPTNPSYSQADTVMSYNVVVDRNGAVVPYGFTSSDASAIRNWWNTSGFEQQDYIKPESVGDFEVIQADSDMDHGHNHFEIRKPQMPVYKLGKSGNTIDFAEVWAEKADKITSILNRKSNGSSPMIVKLSLSDDSIDLGDWSGSGLDDGVSVGHLLIKGRGGDDEFVLRGNKIFGDDIYAKDLVVSGGRGVDTVILDDAFDFPNAKAGMLAGNKVIRFFGESEQVEILDGAKVINADKQQGVIIREDVQQIQVLGEMLSFGNLYDAVQAL